MKQILSDDDRLLLDQLITATEKRTGTQIVLAVVKRSDVYAEIPWKAFALTASMAGMAVIVTSLLLNYWVTQSDVLIAIAATLLAGALVALITVFVPAVARIFLSDHRAEEEVRQYADSLFLEKELFATHKRMGIMFLVSLFERKVVLVPDTGLSKRLTQDEMQLIIAPMITCLRKKEIRRAFEEGLAQFTSIPKTAESSESYENELPNSIIEEEGV
jgi:putative membrane protein